MSNHSSTRSLIEAKDVRKSYGNGSARVDVLNGIDLNIAQGEVVFIMGPSGVGKSTLLNLIGTLDKPTSGTIRIDGQDVFAHSERKMAAFRNEHIGFIFQFHHLLPDFDALENVLMPALIRNGDLPDSRERAISLLNDVGMGERLHHKPNQLSGGEQQRVAIARALMNSPKLILADEPTGDLDRGNSLILFDLILKLNKQYQQTFIVVTHDEVLAEKADRIITLANGRVAGERLLKQPQ